MSGVALIYPYYRTHATTEMLFSPLGLAVLAAQLRKASIEVKVFDCTFRSFEQIQSDLLAYQPEIAGVYCMVTLSRNTFRMAEMLREGLPGCLRIAGGPLPTLYPGRFIGSFDAIFRGEADLSFPRFCHDYLALSSTPGRKLTTLPLESYGGLYLHQSSLVVDNPPLHHTEKEISTFPIPYRGDFDHVAYQQAGMARDGTRTASIITTFGCPFDCDFCSRPIFGNLFRRRSMESVMEEVRQIRTLGYDHLWIADDNFTLNLSYLREFCHRMSGQGIQWSCLSRVTGLNTEICALMKSAGCRRVYLGLESGSQGTLDLMNKKATLEEGIQAVTLFRSAGIEVAAFFIVGYPGETVASIESTFDLALTLPFDDVSFNVPFPLPGSRLFERVSDLDISRDWDLENEVTFIYHSEFDEDWLRRRIDETLRLFAANKHDQLLQITKPKSSVLFHQPE